MGGMPMLITAVLVFSVYVAAVLSPFLVAAYLAVFRGGAVPRRGLFLLVAPALAYGFIVLAWVLIVLPVELFTVYLLPTLRAAGSAAPLWEVPLYRIGDPLHYVVPVALLALSYFVVLNLWRRWPFVARALA
jgi:hypothetical protein